MAYTPAKAWKDGYGAGSTRINAADLMHIEDGIAAASVAAEQAAADIVSTSQQLTTNLTKAIQDGDQQTGARVIAIVNDMITQMNKRTSPCGTVAMFAGQNCPDGWLWCNGGTYKQSEYPKLFAIIGNYYGGSRAAGTFAVPNMTYRFPLGWGEGAAGVAGTVGATGGEDAHTLTFDEMPSHGHDISATQVGWNTTGVYATNIGAGDGWNYLGAADGSEKTRAVAANSGGGKSHNNMPPFLVIKFMIRWGEWTGIMKFTDAAGDL